MTTSPRQILLPLGMFALILVLGALVGWNPWLSGTTAAVVAIMLAAIATMVTASRRAASGDESGDL
jgi:membrane protein implicated in regulation of membrane protease activity